jgi:hypothetical protein
MEAAMPQQLQAGCYLDLRAIGWDKTASTSEQHAMNGCNMCTMCREWRQQVH